MHVLVCQFTVYTCIVNQITAEADLEGGVRGVRPPKIRKAYVIQH